jgi:pilus assembly protein Flp/PilA
MEKMKNIMNWLKNEESGQGMVEYALIIALVSVVAIAVLIALGPKIVAVFQKADNAMNGVQ